MKLCRHVKARSPQLWQRFVRFSNKAAVADFIEAEDGFILTEFYANQAYHTPAVCIGEDPDQPNGRLCLDLTRDIYRLELMTNDELQSELSLKPCPIRKIRTNAAPTLTPLWEAPETILASDKVDDVEAMADRVIQNQVFKNRLIQAYVENRQPFDEPRSVEEMLYTGFPNRSDETLMASFHQSSWNERPTVIHSLEDARLKEFGLRLFGFEARSAVRRELVDQADHSIANCLVDDTTGRLTLAQSYSEVEKILMTEQVNYNGLKVMTDFRDYLAKRIERVSEIPLRTPAS